MLKKILLTSVIGIVITVVGAVATPTDLDRKTPSSKAYVDTSVATKQLKIPAAGQSGVGAGETVMTYTANGNGEIGERGLYSDASSYNATADGDKLITASALNDTFTNLPTTNTTKLECANQGDGCSLWTIVDQTAYGIQLPTGYTRLEYIESTGTQYIDTGVYIISNNLVVKTKVYSTTYSSSSEQDVFGNQDGIDGRTILGLGLSNAWFLYTRYGTAVATQHVTAPAAQNQIFNIEAHIENGRKWLVVDGVATATGTATNISNSNKTVQLFANGATNYFFKGRIYNFEMWDNGTLVRNLIPAKNSSNVRGMYDLVSGTFFTNAATSGEDFRPGPVAQ